MRPFISESAEFADNRTNPDCSPEDLCYGGVKKIQFSYSNEDTKDEEKERVETRDKTASLYLISWGKAPHDATPQAKCKHQKSTNSYEIDIKRLGILTVLCR
jgi:hypothetical protein